MTSAPASAMSEVDCGLATEEMIVAVRPGQRRSRGENCGAANLPTRGAANGHGEVYGPLFSSALNGSSPAVTD
jgi:hypothetical protein